MDTLTPLQRSERMSRVRAKDTRPERAVRSLLHHMGYRFRLHDRALPGAPDIVLRARASVILVHGCFWHRHSCFNGKRLPKSRVRFWRAKLEANKARDARTRAELRRLGWRVLVVWECEAADPDELAKKLRTFLGSR